MSQAVSISGDAAAGHSHGSLSDLPEHGSRSDRPEHASSSRSVHPERGSHLDHPEDSLGMYPDVIAAMLPVRIQGYLDQAPLTPEQRKIFLECIMAAQRDDDVLEGIVFNLPTHIGQGILQIISAHRTLSSPDAPNSLDSLSPRYNSQYAPPLRVTFPPDVAHDSSGPTRPSRKNATRAPATRTMPPQAPPQPRARRSTTPQSSAHPGASLSQASSSRPPSAPGAPSSSSQPSHLGHTAATLVADKIQRGFSSSSGSSGHFIYYRSVADHSLGAPPNTLDELSLGDIYVHVNDHSDDDQQQLWLYTSDGWKDITDCKPQDVAHPVHADRCLTIRQDGTPNWVLNKGKKKQD
ncbi:hypothetical protein DFH06DRAFT_1146162 [Mycena polygramma]|nr:hypothetical protein DFH06DRAFT_1146162 [Mycena polygramma]